MSLHSNQRSQSQDPETNEEVKLLAYRLWLGRRDRNVSGDANCDYYQAERILESRKNRKRLLLGSFGVSAVAFVLGHSQEEHYTNATNALIGLNELLEQGDLSPELCFCPDEGAIRLSPGFQPRESSPNAPRPEGGAK